MSEVHFASFQKKLEELKSIANRAVKATDVITASDAWTEAFEHFFPAPDDDELKKISEGNSNALAVVQFNPIVHVRATSKKNSNLALEDTNKIGPIPKGCDLVFTLSNFGNLPPSASIHWTVRNEGKEAELENDLGHFGTKGPKAFEESAYAGRHFMDCTIRNAGNIIGFRRIPVIIQGVPVAPRNPPPRKKTWL